MPRSSFSRLGWTGCALSGLLVVGCGETPTASTAPELRAEYAVAGTESAGPSPLVCPATEARSASAVIDARGGTVSVDGHSVRIPASAVLGATRITITRPASDYLELDLRADDHESFEFRRPVTVTISYAGCEVADDGGLDVWHIDGGDGTFLEAMDASIDAASRTVTFETGHFSYFMVAS